MNVVSFGSGENLSVPQYHSKMIFISFCLLYKRKILSYVEAVSLLVRAEASAN